ncbi:MAG: ribonuclease R [Oscillospiraceae bacterium]|nr:ribonuclease R [Oscillospiraceae bacterium]
MARHNSKHNRKKAHTPVVSHPKHPADPAKTAEFERKIRLFLQQSPDRRMQHGTLAVKCRARRSPAAFHAALEKLLKEGTILQKGQAYSLASREDCFQAVVTRLSAGYGFIRDDAGTEHFVPGKFLMGSMPGDRVLARPLPARDDRSPEAEVAAVLEAQQEVRLSGTVVPTEEGLCLLPDTMNLCLHIDYQESEPYGIGDKVLCLLTSRGSRHADHRVKVLLNYGSAENAENCMAARIAADQIPVDFPEEVLQEAKKLADAGITSFDLENRLDLRGEIIFTIDGAGSKDMDDAVSVTEQADGSYTLGVHIADVSHYVRSGSALDKEAFLRGTSIYYADKVIPMLPPELSNGICSLNGGEDRLTISCIMQISPQGDLLSAEFRKSVICSAVRGVYSECNAILDGSAAPDIREKYAPVAGMLHTLDALTEKLETLRKRRGAPELESTEAALMLDENGRCVGLAPVQRGRSECIIEACMLAANEAAAKCAREAQIPLVYRVHEQPSAERIEQLKEMLVRLGGTPPTFHEAQPRDIQQLLNACREETWFPVINSLTLRSMAKARYSEEPLGHFGLALKDYAHFTSPIRRYPDLVVHRILTDYLAGAGSEWMGKRYAKFTQQAALQASDTELRAIRIEREADDCYAAEFMQAHVGETFRGVITSVTDFGVYVTLENMAEGLLHIRDMPEGEYEIEEGWFIKDTLTGREYRLGMPMEVICAKADISGGHIDLALAEPDNG